MCGRECHTEWKVTNTPVVGRGRGSSSEAVTKISAHKKIMNANWERIWRSKKSIIYIQNIPCNLTMKVADIRSQKNSFYRGKMNFPDRGELEFLLFSWILMTFFNPWRESNFPIPRAGKLLSHQGWKKRLLMSIPMPSDRRTLLWNLSK